MTYHTHFAGGILFGEIVTLSLGYATLNTEAGMILIGSAIGGILPDIDHSNSFVSKSTMATKVVSAVATSVTKHRGFFHTPIAATILALLMFLTPFPTLMDGLMKFIGIGIIAGYISHLVLDSFNPGGIMWLWPFTKKKFRVAFIKTQSRKEILFRWITVALIIVVGLGFVPSTTEAIKNWFAVGAEWITDKFYAIRNLLPFWR